jgi:hypothetical protein
MDIQKISHAEPNWEVKVNGNFANLTADTGWIPLPVLAPFSGTVLVRKYGALLEIIGTVSRTIVETNKTILITTLPSNLIRSGVPGIGIIPYTESFNSFATLSIGADGKISFYSSESNQEEKAIKFDETIIL